MTTYLFRVLLLPNPPLDFAPDAEVWRDLEVDDSHTLADLHEAIFEAFGRHDTHGYEFLTHDEDGIATRSYVASALYDGSPSWPSMDDEDVDRFVEHRVPDDVTADAEQRFRELRTNPPEEGNAAETTIEALDLDTSQSLFYEFDFGDSWEHHVELREISAGTLEDDPRVVERQGDAPEQYPDV